MAPPGSFVDECVDLQRAFPEMDVRTIVDVGANTGDFALRYHRLFPKANIKCFEPVPGTFRILENRTDGVDQIECYECALGAQRSETTIHAVPGSECNSLQPHLNYPGSPGAEAVSISIRTLDECVRAWNVGIVDLLKTDTEGYDLHVLEGAQQMFGEQRVRVVLSECTFSATDCRHTQFQPMCAFLAQYGFELFGFYRQRFFRNMKYWFADAMFVHRTVVLPASERGSTATCNSAEANTEVSGACT